MHLEVDRRDRNRERAGVLSFELARHGLPVRSERVRLPVLELKPRWDRQRSDPRTISPSRFRGQDDEPVSGSRDLDAGENGARALTQDVDRALSDGPSGDLRLSAAARNTTLTPPPGAGEPGRPRECTPNPTATTATTTSADKLTLMRAAIARNTRIHGRRPRCDRKRIPSRCTARRSTRPRRRYLETCRHATINGQACTSSSGPPGSSRPAEMGPREASVRGRVRSVASGR